MQTTLKQLYSLNPGYVSKNPDLFAKFLAGIQPAMSETDLQAQMEADRRLQVKNRKRNEAAVESGLMNFIFLYVHRTYLLIPKYLSEQLENIQTHAMKIIHGWHISCQKLF